MNVIVASAFHNLGLRAGGFTLPSMTDQLSSQVSGLPENVASSIARAIGCDVPAQAIGFYARWWQFETWLRQLAYTELRARYGMSWLEHLVKTAPSRAAKDEINTYMASPDASNTLAYLDFRNPKPDFRQCGPNDPNKFLCPA